MVTCTASKIMIAHSLLHTCSKSARKTRLKHTHLLFFKFSLHQNPFFPPLSLVLCFINLSDVAFTRGQIIAFQLKPETFHAQE